MNRSIVAVLIPVVVLIGWCLWLESRAVTGTAVQLPITGYDPRDLLSGHFMRYRLELGESNPCGVASAHNEVCACVAAQSAESVSGVYWAGSCAARPAECRTFLRGRCDGSRFVAGVEQYFIPEDLAPQLQRLPEEATIVLALDRAGHATVLRMLVAGEPVEEYARRIQAEQIQHVAE